MKLQKLLKGRSPQGTPSSFDDTSHSERSTDGIRMQEEVSVNAKRVNQPTQYDVLFGRGKPYQGHAGNIRLHKVVELYKPRYCQARRHEKTEIAEEIVQFIKNGGGNKAGRFLKREEGQECWVEVSDSIARDKVSHALRGKPRKDASTLAKEHLKEELAAAKRPFASEAVENPAKRLKAAQPATTEMELLAAQRANGSVLPSLNRSSQLFGAASTGFPSIDLQSQLLASALAERSLGLGPLTSHFGGLSHLFGGGSSLLSPHLMAGDLNPLLQGLRAEQALRADPRLWM